MKKPTKHSVAYIIPDTSPNTTNQTIAQHCLGINKLALDFNNGLLFSGGRDGLLVGWDVGNLGINEKVGEPIAKYSSHHHSDWINDVVLSSDGTSVFTASNDRTVKRFDVLSGKVATIGSHADFAKSLGYCLSQQWVCSGGLDGNIHVWDIVNNQPSPVVTLSDPLAPTTSYYSLAVGETGRLVAGGSPDGLIRLWDPRSDTKSGTIANFTGHTDSVRSLLMSGCGKFILSGSSDSTVKLWSLSSQRCIKTYAIHSDPIWCLSSNDDFKSFYAGSKSGKVTKTLISDHLKLEAIKVGNGSIHEPIQKHIYDINDHDDDDDDDVSNTIVLCQESAGVTSLVGKPDHSFLFTATTKSHISKWQDIPPLFNHSDETEEKEEIDKGDCSDEEYSSHDEDDDHQQPIRTEPAQLIQGRAGLIRCLLLSNRRHCLTLDTNQHVTLWDIVLCKISKKYGKVDLDDTFSHLNPSISVPSWCTIDTKIGSLMVRLNESTAFDAEIYQDELEPPHPLPDADGDVQINLGKWVLKSLFYTCTPESAPKQKEETKDQNEEGAAERTEPNVNHNPDNHTIQPPQPALSLPPMEPLVNGVPKAPIPSKLNMPTSPTASPTPPDQSYFGFTTSPTTNTFDNLTSSTSPPHSNSSDTKDYSQVTLINPPPPALSTGFMGRLKSFSVKKLNKSPDQPKPLTLPTSQRNGAVSPATSPPPTPKSTIPARLSNEVEDKLGLNTNPLLPVSQNNTTSATNQQSVLPPVQTQPGTTTAPTLPDPKATPVPPTQAIPLLDLPPSLALLISSESPDVSGCIDVYSSTLHSQNKDQEALLKFLPEWVANCLFKNILPNKDPVKLPFLLKPFIASGLSPLPSSNTRLLAARSLRARKLVGYVWDRLNFTPDILHNLLTRRQQVNNPSETNGIGNGVLVGNTGGDGAKVSPDALPPLIAENWIVLSCNGQPVPSTMTLATCKYLLWKSGGDMVLNYDIQPVKQPVIQVDPPNLLQLN